MADGRVDPDVIKEIKRRADLVGRVALKVELRPTGAGYKGRCPFHDDRHPSFFVYPESGRYVCFSCGEGGDVFSWLDRQEGRRFPEAVRELAAEVGIAIEVAETPRDEVAERIVRTNERAAIYYADQLERSRHGREGRDYAAARGLDRETRQRWGLGYAPDYPDHLIVAGARRGLGVEDLVEAGLAIGDPARERDRFRRRLLFPIRDRDGRLVGFSGRAVGESRAKYLNTAANVAFHKGHLLYGLHLAREAIRRAGEAVIVEGYLDTIRAHAAGFANVVASMGVALTPEQLDLLQPLLRDTRPGRRPGRVVLALDGDAAGRRATLEALERLPSGSIAVATLPPGEDPDDLIARDPEVWRALVAAAEPLLAFVIRAVAADAGDSAEAASAAAQRVAPFIRNLPDDIQRTRYTIALAEALGVPVEATARSIRVRLARRGDAPTGGPRPAPAARALPAVRREDHLIGVLLAYPEVARAATGEIAEGDFADTANGLLWRSLRVALDGGASDAAAVLSTIDGAELRGVAEALIAEHGDDALVRRLVEAEVRETLRLLRDEHFQDRLRRIQRAIRDSDSDDEQRHLMGLLQTTHAEGRPGKGHLRVVA